MPTLSSILPPISLASTSGTLTAGSGGTGATTLTGVVKGNGAGAMTAGTVSLTTEVSGTLPVARGGTGATTLTGVVKGNGAGVMTAGTVSLTTEVSGTLPVGSGGTGATTLAANNVLLGNGTSVLQAVAPGAAGNILTSNGTTWASTTPAPSGPTLTAVASGSLSDGSRVIINADGTVSVVAGTATGVGTATVFNTGGTNNISATYDSVQQRVVIAYRNNGGAGFGTAIVGTVSGSSISFGTPVVFRSASTSSISATYDSVQQRVVIAYQDGGNSNRGTAIVGTVSGTSISFGTAVVFITQQVFSVFAVYNAAAQRVVIVYQEDSNFFVGTASVGAVSGTSISFGSPVVISNNYPAQSLTAVYDSVQQRVVVVFSDSSISSRGTAIIGTVSGSTISFGSLSAFTTTSISNISATYDSVQQRVVIAYRDTSNFGSAIVGTVSGTSISFGTPVVFFSGLTEFVSANYDSAAQKVLISYMNGSNSQFGTSIIGTVSGTSISFGTAVVFSSASSFPITSTYNSAAQRVVIAYANNSSSSFGYASVFQIASTNLTSENFIGFSNAAYTNGQTATIQIVGSVDDAQSGLTPGQSYFVQNDGTIGLTPGTPSVFAGTAVAATKIIVKG